MKKKTFLARVRWGALAMLATGGLLLTSCASDGFNEETFVGTGEGYQLIAPDANNITVRASSDKLYQTITWEAVKGAGTYTVTVSQGDEKGSYTNIIEENKIVKVNYITVPRVEKTYYEIKIVVNDNIPEGNTGVAEPVVYEWSTFTIEMGTIPANTDLVEWFTQNPIPEDFLATDITYRLADGEEYTLSDVLDLGNTIITFRPVSDTGRAKMKFTGAKAGFETSNGLTLREIDFDCSASDAAFISLSKNPGIEPVIVNAWGADYNFYCAKEPIAVLNCNIEGLNSFFLWDNKVSCWFPTTVLVDNCLVHLTTTKTGTMGTNSNSGYFWTNKGSGYILNLTIKNSTFYNTGELDAKYFVQYGGFGWSQTNPETSLGWGDNTITYENCTFYHVCSAGQWGNYNGVAGKSTSWWNMKNCIFFDCSSGNVPRRFLAGKQNQATATFDNNTYMKKDGTFENDGNLTNFDKSGTDIQEDPIFADPENGDFHISGATQVARRTGDPRWLP